MSSVTKKTKAQEPAEKPGPEQTPSASAERYRLKIDVGVFSDDVRGQGQVSNMSVSGALIDHTDVLPEEGELVRLGFSFHAHALPVPITGRVVRHTEGGGFAASFEDIDFRTQVLLRTLLPSVSEALRSPPGADVTISSNGRVEALLSPALHAACLKLADDEGISLSNWIVAQLELAALKGYLND